MQTILLNGCGLLNHDVVFLPLDGDAVPAGTLVVIKALSALCIRFWGETASAGKVAASILSHWARPTNFRVFV